MIDLHTHSNRSDGSLAPAELLSRAAAAGVLALALTDHDSIDGLDEAWLAAAEQRITLVPGVEISACWRSQAIHVLGLWIDPGCARMRRALALQGARRRQRMQKLCAQLTKIGLPGAALHEAVLAQPGLPTRAHLARALVDGGHVARPDDAFKIYLGRGRAAQIAADWPPLEAVVGWIRAAGGCASLAHPMRYRLSSGARRRLLADFAAAGGESLEVVSGGNGAHQLEPCAALAAQFGLRGSVGSDFHGPQFPWNPLGRLAKLPHGVIPAWHGRGIEQAAERLIP
ncbi:MAG TPA: PHP domain-containing protein [Steroidobacteraceae bacterium]|nr:PHP domain-containing protein [Steroidobacteraceae bacterium]